MATVTEAKTTRGFKAPCPNCGKETVRLDLQAVSNFSCWSCDEEFSLDSIRKLVAGWTAVLKWIEIAPNYPELLKWIEIAPNDPE